MKLTREHIKFLAESAGMAPSGGNVQPWRMVVQEQRINLYLHPTRADSFLDIEHLASIFALGAFAENLRIAAEALGLRYSLHALPYNGIQEPVAYFDFHERAAATAEGQRLAPMIPVRCTNRRMHEGLPIGDAALSTLKNAADNCACALHLVHSDADKQTIAGILGKTDRMRFRNQTLHKQMFDELRFSPQETNTTRDGIDLLTLEMPPQAMEQIATLRDYGTVQNIPDAALEQMALPSMLGSSHIGLLTLAEPCSATRIFDAGRIMQRVWLEATALDLAIQPWSVLSFLMLRAEVYGGRGLATAEQQLLTELGADLRGVFSLAQQARPIFIFRLSKAPPASARALRLPWENYTEVVP